MKELLETLEVSQDKKTVRALKTALKEAEDGKAKPLDELIRVFDLENEPEVPRVYMGGNPLYM